MSGGSWSYIYRTLAELAGDLEMQKCPERRRLVPQLERLAKAMHDIEWVDSSDFAPGDEMAAIAACLDKEEG